MPGVNSGSAKVFAVAALLLALPAAAHAQSVNYGELEDLFGEPVTTSVTGKPQRASEAPAALVIITRDDIRRSPANDIPGLIQAYAGIDVVRWTAGQSDVAIRGGVQPFNPRLLVLVNGRQVYLDHYGMTNWAGLGVQLEEIQQIEIVRGPISALFGFNAASGAINIITIDPLQTQQVTVTAEVGTEGQRRVSGVAALKLNDHMGLRLSGGYDVSDELDGLNESVLASQASDPGFDPRHAEAAGEFFVRPDDRTEGRLSAAYSNNRVLELVPANFSLPDHYKFTSIGAHISRDTGWGVVSAHVLHNWSNINLLSPAIEPGLVFRNRVFVASTDALIRAGTSNILRVGLEYRANQLKTSPGYAGATRYDVLAASGMWESRLDDAITFTVAGRVDHLVLEQEGVVDQPTIFTKEDFDRSITAWSFNTALLFKLSDANALRIAGGRGIQAPSLFSFGSRVEYSIPGTSFSAVGLGNPAIAPAKTWSGEASFIRLLGQNGGRLELTAFYNRTNDVISVGDAQTPPRTAQPAYPFILGIWDNVGTLEAYGLEASLTGRFAPSWTWALNYTWTSADQDIVGNSGGLFTRPLALDSATPEHKVKAQLSYERGPWLATVAARYTSDVSQLVASPPMGTGPMLLVRIDDSLALDAKLAFKLSDRLTFAIAGENLTDAAGVDLSPAPAERRLRASVQIRF